MSDTIASRGAPARRLLSGIRTTRRGAVAGIAVTGTVLGLAATIGAPAALADTTPVCSNDTCTVTFGATGAAQSWTVPDGVTSVTITADGAQGASDDFDDSGGKGGAATGTVVVSAGQVLDLRVGAGGGYGGGGAGSFSAGGGGGGTYVSTGSTLLLVAGGGGGGGYGSDGGAGGGANQAGDNANDGGGGSLIAGGYAGFYAQAGSGPASSSGFGIGGAGSSYGGGGGGGGYYGGGGGYYAGGGSGYADASVTDIGGTVGANSGDGSVTISYEALPDATVGVAYSGSLYPPAGTAPFSYALDSGSQLPDGLTLASDGGLTGTPTTAGDYTFDVDVTDSTSTTTTVTYTLTVDRGTQTITFATTPPSGTFGGSYVAHATSSVAGEPVGIALDPSVTSDACSITSGAGTDTATVHLDHAGVCALLASQPGDANYEPASTGQTFYVNQAPQSITFVNDPAASAQSGTSATLTAVGDRSGNPVRVAVDPSGTACSIGPVQNGIQDGTGLPTATFTVSYTQTGSCVLGLAQDGSADYAATNRTVTTAVVTNITSTSVTLDRSTSVAGQPVHATATVTGGGAGSVQFTVDGQDVGTAVTVTNGSATATLTPAVGSHQVGARFVPTDTQQYGGSTATTVALTVSQAGTSTAVAITAKAITATVAAVAPGAGTPTGTVTFSANGTAIGTATLSSGTATLTKALAGASTQKVTATYGGDASFAGSAASATRTPPTITAKVTSAAPRATSGWYRSTVTVTFTCKAGSAAVVSCPKAVTLSKDGLDQKVTGTVTAADGGSRSLTVLRLSIDRTAPTVSITGARNGATYSKAPAAKCSATDALSGVASCSLSRTVKGSDVTYVATATDRAGNVSTKRITVHLKKS